MTGAWRWDGDDLLMDIHLQPKAARDGVAGLHDGAFKIRLKAPATDGRANKALIAFVAEAFATPPSRIELERGAASRRKRLRIHRPARRPDWLDAA